MNLTDGQGHAINPIQTNIVGNNEAGSQNGYKKVGGLDTVLSTVEENPEILQNPSSAIAGIGAASGLGGFAGQIITNLGAIHNNPQKAISDAVGSTLDKIKHLSDATIFSGNNAPTTNSIQQNSTSTSAQGASNSGQGQSLTPGSGGNNSNNSKIQTRAPNSIALVNGKRVDKTTQVPGGDGGTTTGKPMMLKNTSSKNTVTGGSTPSGGAKTKVVNNVTGNLVATTPEGHEIYAFNLGKRSGRYGELDLTAYRSYPPNSKKENGQAMVGQLPKNDLLDNLYGSEGGSEILDWLVARSDKTKRPIFLNPDRGTVMYYQKHQFKMQKDGTMIHVPGDQVEDPVKLKEPLSRFYHPSPNPSLDDRDVMKYVAGLDKSSPPEALKASLTHFLNWHLGTSKSSNEVKAEIVRPGQFNEHWYGSIDDFIDEFFSFANPSRQ